MCDRHISSPRAAKIAPHRLRLILDKIGPPHVLCDKQIGLAQRTLRMIRIAHDTICHLDHNWLRDADFSHVKFNELGSEYIAYALETLKELHGRLPERVIVREELRQIVLILDRVSMFIPLSNEEWERLNKFLQAFVQVLHNLTAVA